MFTSSTKLFQSITPAGAAAGYQIARSLRFNSADSAYLNRTPASAGNRKTWTYSTWLKRSSIGSGTAQILLDCSTSTTNITHLRYVNGTTENIVFYNEAAGTANGQLVTTAVYRDVSAFYHIVLAVDTTQATASNRIKLYINGTQVTAFDTANYPTQNSDLLINSANQHRIGNGVSYLTANYLSGYLADTRIVDGQQLDATSFGETDSATGVWVPKTYTGTYGTNGFWLKFDDNSGTTSTTLGKDSSGNGNNWTPNNFSVTAGAGNDSLVDSPTNYGTDTGAGGEVRGNYATLNPLAGLTTGTLSNGNLDLVGSTSTDSMRHATIGIPSGKWYAEVTVNVASSSATMGLAVYGQSAVGTVNGTPSRGYYHTGQKYSNGTLATYGNSFTNGDVIGIAVDVSNGKIWFSKNGTWQASGDPAAGTNAAYTDLSTTETWFLTVQTGSSGTAPSCSWNFGQRPFAYTAPSGFKALCTQNLPTPAIGASSTTQADDYFNAVAYSGNSSTQTITTGFQPDLVWIKSRSTADIHSLQDVLRGARYYLISNSTAAEATQPDSDGVSSFTSTGFSLGYTDSDAWNKTGNTYISWAWKANGAGSSNTAGTITSTVSANQTAGISIVTYTGNGTSGATVGHGLGVAPRMVITKKRETGGTDGWWATYHASLSANTNLMLNSTSAAAGTASWTQGIIGGVSSSTFTLTSGGTGAANVNDNTYDYVAYCFAEVAGFSKFGSYTGNGAADGPFVYCGFRPRWILIKRTDASNDWYLNDTARNDYNVATKTLNPNLSAAEGTLYNYLDILSNGFKCRTADGGSNANGGTYIYAAFAEAPFNYSRAR
jgi:hypothetical protein